MRIGLISLAVASIMMRPPAEKVTVYKSPTCRCCSQWVFKRDHGITPPLGSCHTAVVGGYVIEGHVPPDLVKKLLHDHPAGVTGLAVPGMPNGAPGMESPGAADHYDVLALHADGQTVYEHR